MNGRQSQFLVFLSHGERFALRLEDIAEVMESFTAFPIPNAPPCLIGVINFHGSAVPVLDLAAFLHGTPPCGSGAILVLDHAIASLALRVDAVERIFTGAAIDGTGTETGCFMGPPVTGDGGEKALTLLSLEDVVDKLDELLRGRVGARRAAQPPEPKPGNVETKS